METGGLRRRGNVPAFRFPCWCGSRLDLQPYTAALTAGLVCRELFGIHECCAHSRSTTYLALLANIAPRKPARLATDHAISAHTEPHGDHFCSFIPRFIYVYYPIYMYLFPHGGHVSSPNICTLSYMLLGHCRKGGWLPLSVLVAVNRVD